ncbi:hypothetical protein IV203_034301 [Nitzschia inconspicua]|uniref:Uncharacterized protein n=1 Tax=Nitzschia inconspicua TaxID=303405 RepID=A0A9K3M426_9STRA|nr:hypothetical protein IV203_034294 [Nitzschia inconspicua]KAG7373577.1 hypothetical protein IV203_034301 [Nitzschia inconspicua]
MSLPESRRAKVLLAILLAVQIVLLGLQFDQKRRTTATSPTQGTDDLETQTLGYMKAHRDSFAGIHKHKESEYRQLRPKSDKAAQTLSVTKIPKDSSSRGTGLSSNAASFFQTTYLTHTSKSTKAPTEKSTKAPTNKSTKAPTNKSAKASKASKSDDIGPPVNATLADLSMILTFEDESTWDETTESTFENSLAEFSESSINSNFAGAVRNFETSIEVTEVARVTPGRRLLTSQENPNYLRRLQGSSVIVTYTQNMAYETSDPTTFAPTFLAAAPLDTTAGQNEFVQVLQNSGDPVLSTVADVSSVTVPSPAPVSPPTTAPTETFEPTLSGDSFGPTLSPAPSASSEPMPISPVAPVISQQPVSQQPTIVATTQLPTIVATTQPPTITATNQPTIVATTQPPTIIATTQPPTIVATTQPPTATIVV